MSLRSMALRSSLQLSTSTFEPFEPFSKTAICNFRVTFSLFLKASLGAHAFI